jgi:hypothetical protein
MVDGSIAIYGMTWYDPLMPQKAPFAKIAITLPQHDLAAADRLAAEHDRSRSWIIAEALRQYVARAEVPGTTAPLDPQRLTQLRRDLTLTPLERVLASEESVQVVGSASNAHGANAPLIFDDYDAFLAWRHDPTTPP